MMVLATVSAQFTWIDWGVVAAFLAFTTLLGTSLTGKQATMRDFFLGGRKLPWYAVSGSIIATEISAVTFISVPFMVFKDGGNFTYLQLGVFGSVLARLIVGYVLVPQYYRKEIYSPYDYMGNQLGQRVRTMTSGLFVLGAMLSQAARVYLTIQIVLVLLNDQIQWLVAEVGLDELAWAAIGIGVISIGWALFGGITTVIWTNLTLFVTFLVGALTALAVVAYKLDGGFVEILQTGWAARESGHWGKFTFFDFSTDPLKDFTIWTAVIASTWGGLFSYGTDHMLVQGMFCCRNEREARKAIIGSSFGLVVTATVLFVGVGLYTYYQTHPLTGEALEMYQKKGDRILPIFICQVVPIGLKGLVMAAALGAAISTVMGVLTALSQTVLGAFYTPVRRRLLLARLGTQQAVDGALNSDHEHRRNLILSRGLIVFWGVLLCTLAYLTDYVAHREPSILQLALAAAQYAGGAMIGCFALAFLPLGVDGRGFMWSAPLAVAYVYALYWHDEASQWACGIFAALLFAGWLVYTVVTYNRPASNAGPRVLPVSLQAFALLVGLAGMLAINQYLYWEVPELDGSIRKAGLAWPWHAPIGSVAAVVWGYLLARRKPAKA